MMNTNINTTTYKPKNKKPIKSQIVPKQYKGTFTKWTGH